MTPINKGKYFCMMNSEWYNSISREDRRIGLSKDKCFDISFLGWQIEQITAQKVLGRPSYLLV